MNYFIVGLLIGSIVTAIISFLLHDKVSRKIVKFHKKQSNDQISVMESKEQEITKLKAIVTELKKQIKYSQDQPDTTIQQETRILNHKTKIVEISSGYQDSLESKEQEITDLKAVVTGLKKQIQSSQDQAETMALNQKAKIEKISSDYRDSLESKEQKITKLKAVVTELKKQIKYGQDQPDTTIQQETRILDQGDRNANLASIVEAEIISIDENLKFQKIFFNPSEKLPQEYLELKEYLMNRQWQNADQETTKIMFELTKQKNSFLDVKDYPNLPLKDLAIIDGLWAYFSNGLFGFSAQYKAYSDICQGQEINQDKWRKIGDLLGWRKKDQWISSENDLIKSLDAPPGQYPFLPCWKGVWLGGFIDGQSDRFIALMIRFSDVFR